jgi:predicted sulfurtransferase
MTSKRKTLACVTAFLLLGMSVVISPAADEAPRMSIEKLKELMGSPDLIILDVRYGVGWTLSAQKIQGALREDPQEKTREWAGKYGKDKTIVTYCT